MIRKQLFVEMLWVGGIISSLAFGQVNRIQQGNLLDANNRVGSGGMNMIGQTYDFNAGNRIVSGNVVGGRAFRGYSPIRDSSSLFLGSPVNAGTRTSSGTALWGNNYYGSPVDRLNNFYRDSYSYSDQRPPFDTGRSDAYYSNIGNVANTGAIIQGLNRIGTPQLLNPNQSQQSSRLYTDQGYADVYGQNLGGTLVRADTGQPLTGRVNNRLLRSSLFAGAVRPTTAAELADETARLRESMGVLAYAQQRQAIGPIDLQAKPLGPTDLRVEDNPYLAKLPGDKPGSSLDSILNRAAAIEGTTAGVSGGSLLHGGPLSPRPNTGQSLTAAPGQSSGSLLGGASNLYDRMRQISSNPGVQSATGKRGPAQAGDIGGQGGAPGASRQGPGSANAKTLTGEVLPGAGTGSEQGISTIQGVAMEPIRSFVGTDQSVLNGFFSMAERAMREGRYYRAAGIYEMARTISPDNPLPPLGRAMALLSAGDYLTAASDLFEAIGLFDELGLFRIDLKSFVPDPSILDARRADLEDRLKLLDDYRMRFLLGYAEYCSGLEEIGVADMEQALKKSPLILKPAEEMAETRNQEQQPMAESPVIIEARKKVDALQQTIPESKKERKQRNDALEKATRELEQLEQQARIHQGLGQPVTEEPKNLEISSLRRFVDSLRKGNGRTIVPIEIPTTSPAVR